MLMNIFKLQVLVFNTNQATLLYNRVDLRYVLVHLNICEHLVIDSGHQNIAFVFLVRVLMSVYASPVVRHLLSPAFGILSNQSNKLCFSNAFNQPKTARQPFVTLLALLCEYRQTSSALSK